METNKLRNIVVLNNLPSNLVDEAIIVLKKNAKIQRAQKTKQNNKQIAEGKKNKDYILKEAEMLVNCYVSNIEKRNKKIKEKKLKDKYRKLKGYSTLITIGAILELIIIIF